MSNTNKEKTNTSSNKNNDDRDSKSETTQNTNTKTEKTSSASDNVLNNNVSSDNKSNSVSNSTSNSTTSTNNVSEKDELDLYNDVTNAANNLISNIRGKKPNSTQRGIIYSNNNTNNTNSTIINAPYQGELNDTNSKNAINRNIDPEDVAMSKSVSEIAKETRQQFFSSASDLLVTQTALVFDKLLDVATYATLGYHSMSKVTKEDLIDDLTKKRDVMVGVMKDPKGRKIIRDIAYVSAKILTTIIKAIEKPAIEARDKLMNIIVSSSDKIIAKGVILMKNLVKIVPGIGDMYIIADNGLQMTKAASEAAKSGTKAANVTTKSFADMAENVSKIQKPLNNDFTFLEKSMDEFNELREKIRKNTQMPKIDETTQQLKRTISEIGTKATTQLKSLRDKLIEDKATSKPMTAGSKTLKKRRKLQSRKKKSKNTKSHFSLKSCMKTPGCNIRNAVRKTKKKCVKFDL